MLFSCFVIFLFSFFSLFSQVECVLPLFSLFSTILYDLLLLFEPKYKYFYFMMTLNRLKKLMQ